MNLSTDNRNPVCPRCGQAWCRYWLGLPSAASFPDVTITGRWLTVVEPSGVERCYGLAEIAEWISAYPDPLSGAEQTSMHTIAQCTRGYLVPFADRSKLP